jgi:hypothetical protein
MRRIHRRDPVIHGGFLIRALASDGPSYDCTECGDRMFVQSSSGLCPLCFNGRGPRREIVSGPVRIVPERLALAGVLDDPSIEDIDV